MKAALPKPGTYVVAVSGGIDSVSLLHLLQEQRATQPAAPWKLIVAHYDHGIRPESADDRRFVQALAKSYGLPFVYAEGKLGPAVSEATARSARYAFLHHVQAASGARGVVTAHHQDDLLETAILNMLRGTYRRGLTALASRPDRLRPLLPVAKGQLQDYAKARQLQWREDRTNSDTNYLRNYIRHQIIPRLDAGTQERLLQRIQNLRQINQELDTLLVNYLHCQDKAGRLNRTDFINLPHAVAREVLAAWLRSQGQYSFDRRILERLTPGLKTARPHQRLDVTNGASIEVRPRYLALKGVER